ncbi:MAG TPA: 3-hydroxyacyl-CoA dehydrogenase NAD-binding domain-containing protein [Anaerolineales bacterium]
MAYRIDQAVVIGSGTMGAGVAAHLANAGIPVTLLDIVPKDAPTGDRAARNKIVREGWSRCLKAKPANLMSPVVETLVKLGNLEDDFEAVSRADWILEAVIEELPVKQALMARVDATRRPDSIVSTNTSGIPIAAIAEGRSEGFRKHFLGTHFFNPPRYLKLLEIIPGADTSGDVVEYMVRFGERELGKGVVLCKDTPNFIGNRVFFGTATFGINFILENGYTVDEVDALTGPLIGRPRTATFRLADLIGIDVWEHVGRNLGPAIPHDTLGQQYLAAPKPTALLHTMVERKWLGNKTGVGFYKEVRKDGSAKEFWPLNLTTLEHVAPTKPRFESVGKAKDAGGLAERLKIVLNEDDKAASLVRALLYQSFQYSCSLLPEVADTPKPVDDAVRWGFGHEAGPFEIWDMLGVRETADRMKAAGYPPAAWVDKMLQSNIETFYAYSDGVKTAAYDVNMMKYAAESSTVAAVTLKGTKVISKNAGATLHDLGDGVACVEFHTKVNALDDDIFSMIEQGLDCVEQDFEALVIGNEASDFCAGGANLFMVVVAAQQGMWENLESSARRLQNLNMRMRYFPKPVVVAPFGRVLGGGCEIVMHGSRAVASAETYIGLVELGAGIIPAGGGTKEMMRRIINPPMRTENTEILSFLQRAFLQIGQAKVATSALEARDMGILGPSDRVVMNRDQLLLEAKREALHMASSGYRPPAPEPIYVAGRDMLAALRVGGFMFKAGGYISEYDQHLANKLAYVMAGGDLTRPQWVSEQYVLDLEREAFLSLCGEERTQARMWSLLQTGKPLRN